MNSILKMMSAGLFLFLFASCGTDPEDNDTSGDSDTSTEDNDTLADTTPVADLQALVGKTYFVTFNAGYWTTPQGVGEDIGSYVPAFMFTFTAVNDVDGTFTALLGTANTDGSQNTYNKTVTVTGTITTDTVTKFSFNPADFQAILTGPADNQNGGEIPQAIAPIHDFAISGTFINQGDDFKYGIIDALMDLRDIDCLFTLITNTADRNPDYICGQLNTTLGYQCEVCSFEPGTSYCVTMKAENFKASVTLATAAMVEVADFDMSHIDTSACQ